MSPLTVALVRAVIFLLKKTPHTSLRCANREDWQGSTWELCESCELLRDVEREAQ